MNILDELGKRILFFDGGLGSLLQERGLEPGELPETWNLTRPEVLIEHISMPERILLMPILSALTDLSLIILKR